MGFLDKAREKAAGFANKNPDKVDQGIDKVADVADEKTGGKFSDQIDQGADAARDELGIDDEGGDAKG